MPAIKESGKGKNDKNGNNQKRKPAPKSDKPMLEEPAVTDGKETSSNVDSSLQGVIDLDNDGVFDGGNGKPTSAQLGNKRKIAAGGVSGATKKKPYQPVFMDEDVVAEEIITENANVNDDDELLSKFPTPGEKFYPETPLNVLETTSKNFSLKIRLVQTTGVKSNKRGSSFGIHCSMRFGDKSGQMRAAGFTKRACEVAGSMVLNRSYYVSNVSIMPADVNFRDYSNYQIRFNNGTIVKELDEEVVVGSINEEDCEPLTGVRPLDTAKYYAITGVILSCDVDTFQNSSSGETKIKQTISLATYNSTILCVEKWENPLPVDTGDHVSLIGIKQSKGNLVFNEFSSLKTTSDAINKFGEFWLANENKFFKLQKHALVGNNWRQLNSIKEVQECGLNGLFFFRASIGSLNEENFEDMTYDGCPICSKSVKLVEGNKTCGTFSHNGLETVKKFNFGLPLYSTGFGQFTRQTLFPRVFSRMAKEVIQMDEKTFIRLCEIGQDRLTHQFQQIEGISGIFGVRREINTFKNDKSKFSSSKFDANFILEEFHRD